MFDDHHLGPQFRNSSHFRKISWAIWVGEALPPHAVWINPMGVLWSCSRSDRLSAKYQQVEENLAAKLEKLRFVSPNGEANKIDDLTKFGAEVMMETYWTMVPKTGNSSRMMSGYGLIFVGQRPAKKIRILIHFGWTNHNFVLHQPCEEYDGDNIT